MEVEPRWCVIISRMNDGKSKFGYVAIGIWGILAIVGDLVSLIPIVGTFVGPIFWITFAIFLWMKGFGFLNPKRIAVMGVDMVIKMIPFLQEIPVELLIGVIAVVAMIKFEEKTGIKLPGTGGAGGKVGSVPRLNSGGVRMPGQGDGLTKTGDSIEPLNNSGRRAPSLPFNSMSDPKNKYN